jgi:preprotein translocase subunit SecE
MALNEKKQAVESSKGIGKFLKEIKGEIKRITWPPKNQIKKSTIIVLLFCCVYAAIVGVMDYGLQGLYRLIFTK